ncbi:MAG TPA: flagellar motor switch protein FliN [Acidimicrobiia bacterium]|nr:flagellar motor switch protein FliN [Acidimicrobiia bacterium]
MTDHIEQLAAALQQAMAAAGAAAARTIPASGPLELAEPFMGPDGVPVPGAGARAVSARLAGDLPGTVVVAVSAATADAIEHGPVAEQELASGLGATLNDAVAAMAETLGVTVAVDAVQEVAADIAFSGADTHPFVAVTMHDGGEQVAALAVVLEDPAEEAASAELPDLGDAAAAAGVEPLSVTSAAGGGNGNGNGHHASLEILHDVEMGVTAELGRTRMTVKELLALAPGSIVELDRAAGSPVDVLVNGTLVARGEVVVIDEEFGIRISEIVGLGDTARA